MHFSCQSISRSIQHCGICKGRTSVIKEVCLQTAMHDTSIKDQGNQKPHPTRFRLRCFLSVRHARFGQSPVTNVCISSASAESCSITRNLSPAILNQASKVSFQILTFIRTTIAAYFCKSYINMLGAEAYI